MYHKTMKEIVSTSFKTFTRLRKDLLAEHQDSDYVFFQTNSSFLVSAPHGVPQVRLGKLKVAEIGTIPTAMLFAQHTNSNLLIKTQNNDDDANFDDDCLYRQKLAEIIKTQHIKYLVDIHGLAKFRPYDINLGSNFGQNTKPNQKLFDSLKSALEAAGFTVSIDEPFCAGPRTIAGAFAKNFGIWTIQIEINCDITNNPKNTDKCNKLINTLIDWHTRNY